MKQIRLNTVDDVGSYVTVLDDVWYEQLCLYRWFLCSGRQTYYAKCNVAPFLIHLFVMGFKEGHVVHHKDENGLHNWSENLEFVSNAQNIGMQSKVRGAHSQYKGVAFIPRSVARPWRAEITIDYRNHHLGYFATEEEAAMAYDAKAFEVRGRVKGLNFPEMWLSDAPTAVI